MDGGKDNIKPGADVPVPVKKLSYTGYLKNKYTKVRELNVADQVKGLLGGVEKSDAEVENVLSDGDTSIRHKLTQKALNMTKEITNLVTQPSLTNDPVPLGIADSTKGSTSTPSSDQVEVQSRQQIFTTALNALEPDHTSQMIALCGMQGVGKSKMVEKLKKVVKKRKMFHYIVEVVLGENTDPKAIQVAVAHNLNIELQENTDTPARAFQLRKWFHSRGGSTKILIILNDVWKYVDLEDIGCLPPQGFITFKVLLSSRKRDVCIEMGVEESSILNLDVLKEAETRSFFSRVLKISGDTAPELNSTLGEEIVRMWSGIRPMGMKSKAWSLINKSKDYAWPEALSSLDYQEIGMLVVQVFKVSYQSIKDEESRSIFLLCALFPQQSDIPTEDLVRYGWGLKLFGKLQTIREARTKMDKCIRRLMRTNLLIQSHAVGCVKLQGLALDFIFDIVSKVEHAANSGMLGSLSEWISDMSETCKRIIYSSRFLSKFPGGIKAPNISILKLMNVDKSIMFPENFYGDIKSLEVISYSKMKQPMLPSSHQGSTVRVLHLHHCPSISDWSAIGNLSNLEVLSLANSAIEFLPSEVGNLKKLMLLDLTNCVGLRVDNGVLRNLVKLEELYMRVDDGDSFTEKVDDRKAISFINKNYDEMAECSKKFSALEFEFFQNNAEPKNMSFKNLEQFKISMGRSLKGSFRKTKHSFENTLMLAANKSEVLESDINKLFVKTEVFYLSVNDINDVEDIEVKPLVPPNFSSFFNVRVIVISECTELRYLFTVDVANVLRNLEHLEVYSCANIEELFNNKSGGGKKITLPNLKFLSLISLPILVGLCRGVSVIELPKLMELEFSDLPKIISIYPANDSATSCFLKEKVVIPKLEKLQIRHMENLREIWPCEYSTSEEDSISLLKEIEVTDCDNLVNLFPCNPMPLLNHLEHLEVRNCGSIEVLFNIHLNSDGKIREGSSSLRSIEVYQLENLKELWSVKGADNSPFHLIRGFQAIEKIEITKCKRFRNVCTPTTANVDMGAHFEICINYYGESERNNELVETSKEQEINVISNDEETSIVGDNNANVVFPSYRIPSLYNLYKLKLVNSEGVEVVFEIEGPSSRESAKAQQNQGRLVPYLEEMDIRRMDNMSHVWKCNWNNFLKYQKHQSDFPFHKLTTINMSACKSIKYLFSPLMAKLLSNLTNIKIELCDDIEELVSNRDDEDGDEKKARSRRPTLFPRLASLTLDYLRNFKRIGGGGAMPWTTVSNTTISTAFVDQSKVDGVSWSLCQFSREIRIVDCHALSCVVPYYAGGEMQNLRVLKIESCMSMKEVFEGQGRTTAIPRTNNVIILELSSLKILEIKDCGVLENIFTYAVLESLMQLEELTVQNCKAMKVIVKEEPEEKTIASKVVIFRRLKSIVLINLPNLVGFYSGMNNFRWPSSDKYSWPYLKNFTSIDCPKTAVLATGGSRAPEVKDMPTTKSQMTPFLRLDSTSSSSSAPDVPMSFHNLTEVDLEDNDTLKNIIPAGQFLQLKKLEKISVWNCNQVEEVFEAVEGTYSGFDESQSVVKLQSLKKVYLGSLCRLKYIWKSNPRIVYDFPNLTKVNISHCEELKHVFTSSMVGSLLQLRELNVSHCKQMEVIIKNENVLAEEEEEIDGKVNEIMLPSLKSLKLEMLQQLKGFCLGKEDFSLPSLVTLSIEKCPALTIFTKGNLATPELKEIETSSGQLHAGEYINSVISNNLQELI